MARPEHAAVRLRVALATLAIACFALQAWWLAPGTIGFDAAYQWWQARGHASSNVHGVGMLWLWQLAVAAGPAPRLMFWLQLVVLWSGMLLLALRMRGPAWLRCVLLVAVAVSPVIQVNSASVLSDTVLMAVLGCAVACCLYFRPQTRAPALLMLAMLLVFATLVRKNALPAVLPFVFLAFWQARFAHAQLIRACVVATLLAGVALQLTGMLAQRAVEQRQTIFAATALWDLAAISVATGRMCLPPSVRGADLDVAALRSAYTPYANTTLFAAPIEIAQPFFALDDPRNADVWRAWLAAIRAHPRAWLAHRWAVTRGLFGEHPAQWPRELVWIAHDVDYADNPPLQASDRPARVHWARIIEARRDGLAFAAWPYALLALLAMAIAWRRRAAWQAQVALATAASGLAYVAPLPLVAPSAELRYLAWMCLAALLSAALALGARVEVDKPGAGH